jgi:hypothetical protein
MIYNSIEPSRRLSKHRASVNISLIGSGQIGPATVREVGRASKCVVDEREFLCRWSAVDVSGSYVG